MEPKQPWPEWGESSKQPEEHQIPEPPADIPELPADSPVLDMDARASILNNEINEYVILGWRVESRTPTQAVIATGHRPNHILHLILTLVTCVWGIVWIVVATTTKEERAALTVDEYGQLMCEVSLA